jgi:hypothetical protein
MKRHSNGVSANSKAKGHYWWRDEVNADGGKRYIRRRVRFAERRIWKTEYSV